MENINESLNEEKKDLNELTKNFVPKLTEKTKNFIKKGEICSFWFLLIKMVLINIDANFIKIAKLNLKFLPNLILPEN